MKRISLLAMLALAACATVPPPVSAIPTAGLGQVAALGGVRVRPVELFEDSRCPALVRCVWAGQVRLLVDVTRSDDAHQQRELTMGQPQDIDWGVLTLTDVQPPKLAPGATDPAAYRFTFRFEPAR
ncbi:MAG TPA: hypothetical protein VMN38_00430 [Sphingomicrobium sp.]|nr:hypothetical protein [Sphingomicrobium sp.]